MNQHASINRTFRLIWNEARRAWIPAAEITRARGKRSVRAAVRLAPLLAALGLTHPAHAVTPPSPNQLPTGGTVVAGSATLASGGGSGAAVLNVNQTTSRAVIDWNTFNVGSAAQVNFNQPGASSATLNRVLDSNPSQIFGKITAPGQVFLTNPNGVYFGRSASVDVGGLTATTSSISAADFMAGRIKLSRNGATGSVVNDGTLQASLGGYIALLAPEVRNGGVVIARMGTVVMAAGEQITLDFNGRHLAGITTQPSAVQALVDNRSAVIAPGGLIILSAQALDSLQGGLVKNSGTLQATGMVSQGGRIVLEASTGVENSGTISASGGANGGPAGQVTITAPAVTNSGTISATATPADYPATSPAATGGQVVISATAIQQTGSGLIDVSGPIAGDVTFEALQNIDLSGRILATGIEVSAPEASAPEVPAHQALGGDITLTAQSNITLQDLSIDVSGDSGGGQIRIQGGNPAPTNPPSDPPAVDLLGTTELDASSRRGKGGTVALTADRVSLLGASAINTSGATGGGDVYVGGGFHGKNPSVADAQQAIVGAGASIDASATQSGDGGQVVVWSSEDTTFAGAITSRGGETSGSGGTLEVSGAHLDFTGSVNAGAAHGTGGSLLLDPKDITVVTGGSDSVSNETFATNPTSSSTIDPSTITAITDNGTAVTLQANDDITVNSAIQTVVTSGTGGALTFQAGRSITLNAGIISDNGNVTFSANDSGATLADRNAGAATFTNNSLVNAGTGNVSITMGTLGTSGNITTGQVTANNLTVTDNGTTSGTTLDLDQTELTGALSISAAAANPNLTNSVGIVTVHGTATINTGTGNVTITNANTDFTTLGVTGGTVQLVNANAIQFSTTSVGALTETAQGPIAQTGGSSVQVTGAANLTADYGGFGYADPYINLTNSGNHFGSLALHVPTNGGSGTGGYATIVDSGSTSITASSTSSNLTLQAGGSATTGTISAASVSVNARGAVSLGSSTISTDLTVTTNGSGAITNTGAIAVGRQTTLTAGSANNITLDNSGNSLPNVQIVSGDNVTLVDTGGITLGSYCGGCGGMYSQISGTLSVTAGGTITQSNSGADGYSRITVAGATTFTANNASSQIQLVLGNPNGGGEMNSFNGGITLARTNSNTGFSYVYLRDANPSATVLNGINSVGTLTNVTLYYDSAPAVTLPGMTVSGTLRVQAPSVQNTSTTPGNIISQTGPLVVGGNAIFQTSSTGDIVLSNASNNFNAFVILAAHNVTVDDQNAIQLNASGFASNISGNLQVTTNGAINEGDTGGNGISVTGTTTLNPGIANDINLNSGRDNLVNVVITAANNATVDPLENMTFGNATIAGTLTVVCGQANGWAFWLNQASGTAIDMTSGGTTTLQNFRSGITLNQPSNVLGPLAIANSGAINIEENAPITQASAWSDTNTITLTTANDQAIALTQSANDLGPLVITQQNSGATSAGAVSVVNTGNSTQGLTQGGAWTVAGATSLSSGSHSILLNNPNNVLGPLQVTSSAGTTNGVASTISIYAKNTGSTDAITDVGGAGPWAIGAGEAVKLVAYDATGATEGGGNVILTNQGNVLGPLYVKATNVTVTENSSITDGPVLSNWDGVGDSGWATTGSVNLIVANPGGKSISLSNVDNLIGPIALSTTGTAGTLSSVLITDNENLTQNGAWNVGSAPVTLDARTHQISLTNAGNVMGNITINTANGTPTAVAITENDAITQGSAWVLTGVPMTLVAGGGNAITLTNATNIMGNLTVTGGAVSITENGSITQGGAWTTTGTTTLDPTSGAITLTNAGNVLGPLAIAGSPSSVSITENGDITQASAWVEPSTPFTLNSETHDVVLSQATNQLGALTLTGQNATVTEDGAAGITEGSAWTVPGTSTLTAGSANPITLTASPGSSLGTVDIVSASNAQIYTSGGVNFGPSTVAAGGTLTVSAGGTITQSGAISAPSLRLIGTGNATLTNSGNTVASLAAGFSGGDLSFTDSGNFAVGVIGGTSGITIGAHNVTLDAVGGTVTGLTNVNPASASLTVTTGTALTLPQMSVAGAQTYTAGGGGITLTAGATSTQPGAVTFNSPVTLGADLTVQSDNSAITFASTVTGASHQFVVNAGSGSGGGAVTFQGAVSGLGQTTDASPALSLTSAGAAFDSTLSANNGLAVTGPVTFSDTVSLANGSAASVFTGLVTLGKSGGMNLSGYNGMSFDDGLLLQNGPATIDSNNSPLTFQTAGTVSGPYALTLNSGTAALTGLGRMGSNLTGLTVTALSPTIPAGGISIAGPQAYTATSGSSITLDGNVTSTAAGAIAFNGPVTLGAPVTVASTNSPVSFGSTVDGSQNLTVNAGNGTTSFTAAVGGATPVGSGVGASIVLQGSGTTTFSSTVQTRSGITAAGPVVLDGNVTLGNGNTGTVFSGAVTSGGSAGNSISGYGGIAFDGGLTLTGGPVSVVSNGSAIAFGGPVSGAEGLTLNALAGGVGSVSGLNQIGPASPLTSLSVTAQTLSLPATGLAVAGPMSFTAAGGITLNGAVGSASSPSTGQIGLNGPVTLASGPIAVATANAPILFNGTVDGGEPLTVNTGTAAATFTAAVGGTTPLTSLSTNSGGTVLLNGGSIHTSAGQSYGGAATLGTDNTLTGHNVQFSSTIDGAHALTITDSGTTTLDGAIGATTPLTSLNDSGTQGISVDASTLTTTATQTFTGGMTLGTNAAFSGNGIAFDGTIDGAHALTANAGTGTLAFNGSVGSLTPLASLAASGNRLSASNVRSTGAQSYTAVAGVSLGGNLSTTGSPVTITGPTTLTGNTTIATGGGNVAFSGAPSTIDGDFALTLTAGSGNVALGGVVGGVTPLAAFTASGNDLTVADVTTVGGTNQSYTALDNITLTQSRTINAPVSFTADADGNGVGSFILQNGVSLTASNNSLSITAADIDLQGNSTLSSGTGLMTLTATDNRNIYLGGTASAPGQMTITGDELSRMSTSGGLALRTSGAGWIEVNGITAQQSQNITGTLALDAQGTGNISFITAPSTFNAVKADATGGTINVGVDLTTAGHPVEFVTPVSVSGASTIASNGGNISFDGSAAVNSNLTLSTGNGALSFGGPVAGTGALTLSLGGGAVSGLSELQSTLTGLTVNGTAGIVLPALAINGPQVYNTGAITATGNLTGTGITFNNTVNAAPTSGSALALDAGTGTLAFNGLASFGAVNITLMADGMTFANKVSGTGSLTLEPFTSAANIAVGGSGTPITGLNVTAADLAQLPLAGLTGLTIGNSSDTGSIDIAGALNAAATPLTLNGGGGITQSGGAIGSGALTLYAAGNAINLPNTGNAVGAIAIHGSPTAVTLSNSGPISQQGSAGWNLGAAAVTLNAGTHDITLANAGNTFGTVSLTGDNAQVTEAAGTAIGASNLAGGLTVTSSGAIGVTGALTARGNVSLSAAGEVTQSAPLTIGGNLDVSTTLNAGDVTLNNSGAAATTIGNTQVGGNYSLTATGKPVTQAAGTSVQVVGNLTITAGTVDLSGAGNLVGGTTTLPASNTVVVQQSGVINLGSNSYAGNLTVISERTSRSFGSSQVTGNAIVLSNAANDIGGTITVSASPPTITTGADVQTGITQTAGSTLTVAGVASFTAESSSAGTLGINLPNSGNSFGSVQVSGTTVTVNNSAVGGTTLENSDATTSLSLTSVGPVTQTGAVVTPSLTVNASGQVTLGNAANQIGSVSVTSGGNAVTVANTGSLAVAGINAGGGTVSLTAGGTGNLTQTGALQNVSSLSVNAGGAITLTDTGNTIQSLAGSAAGSGLQLSNSGALGVSGTVSTASGNMLVRTTGDLTLASGGVLDAAGGNVVVSTEGAGNFINDSARGGSALQTGSGDRWLVYSDTPDLVSGAHTIKGGLTSNFRHYGATYSSYGAGSVTESGDGFIYDYATPALTVNAGISGAASQVYGDNPTGTLTYTISSGLVDSEDNTSNVITGGTPTYSTALSNALNAGTYTIKYTGGLTSNYTLTADPTGVTYTVTPAVLTYVANGASRTYGAVNPSLSGTITGFKLGQTASVLAGTAAWATIATAASPVGTYAIDGSGYTSNGNYTFAQAAGNAAALTVTKAPLTVTANSDVVTYNGTGFSGGSGVTYSGFVNGDNSTMLGGALAYGGSSQGARNVGSYAIDPSGLTSSNYAITFQDSTLTVDKANLTVTASNVTKTYDGTFAASGAPVATGGTRLFGTDTLSGGTYAFTNANAGSGDKTVTVGGVTVNDGNGGGNYNVTYLSNTTSTINPASLTISAANVTKTYDGTDAATGTPVVVSGTLYSNASNGGARDTLSGGTYAFTDPNAGAGSKSLSVSGVTVTDGNAGGNYNVSYVDNTTSTIDPARLTFSGTIAGKSYDGTTAATLSGYTLTGLVGSQTLNVAVGSANFSDPNAGASKPVSMSGITLSNGANGGVASNYTVSSTANATGTIDPKMLTVDATVANKVYDGTTTATVQSYGLSGFVGNQTVGATYTGSATFGDKNVGTGKAVAITGITLLNGTNGGLASNYAVPTTVAATANITPATLHIAGVVAVNKVYDGTTTADLNTQSAILTGVIGTDNVQVSALTGTFASKNVGANIPIGTGTVTLSGTDAQDYTLVQPTGLTASITPRPLTVSASGVNRVYDGTTAASAILSDNALAGDTVTISATSAFLDANAGSNKYVSVTGIALSGADAGDYVANGSTSTFASITPKMLTVDAVVANKVYDGTTTATVQSYGLSGFVGNQTVSATYAGSAAFGDENVGTGKAVAITGITLLNGTNGGLAGNYAVPTTVAATADITPAPLHIAGIVAQNKVYDGTTTANLNTQSAVLTGVIGTDNVQVSTLTGTFASKNVGTDISINTGTVTLSGTDAQDYTLVQPTGLTASITPRPLTVSATGINKVYDGTTAASVILGDNAIAGDTVTASATSAFLDGNAGANKYVSVTGIALSGADAGNYVANGSTSTFASVTPATLTVTASGENKPYDGTAAAAVTLAGNTLPGDQVSLGDASASFDNSSPGNGKTISVSGIYIAGGAKAGDYVLGNTTATTTGDITGSEPPPPPPPPAPVSSTAYTGVWSQPPAIPQPLPPATPARPANLLQVSLPIGFGGVGESAAAAEDDGNVRGNPSQPADGASIAVSLVTPAMPPHWGLITVSLPEALVGGKAEVRFALPVQVRKAVGSDRVKVTVADGGALPLWLRYLPETQTFVAKRVPSGALPLKILVQAGARSWVVLVNDSQSL